MLLLTLAVKANQNVLSLWVKYSVLLLFIGFICVSIKHVKWTRSMVQSGPFPFSQQSKAWKAMHFSTRRKALHKGKRNMFDKLAGPLVVLLFLLLLLVFLKATVSSSTFIRAALHLSEGAGKKKIETLPEHPTKQCVTCWCFLAWNQRCYLTQVPCVISITLTIPKITKGLLLLFFPFFNARPLWVVVKML